MAVQWKQERRFTTSTPTWTYGTFWRDYAGVEWDVDYVHRFESFSDAIQGIVLGPWNKKYEAVRKTWLGSIDQWPAALVICMNMDDVDACLAYAQHYDLPVAIYYDEENQTKEAIIDGCMLLDVSLFK